MQYSGASARELRLLDELEGRGIIVCSPLEVSGILHVSRESAHRILSRMEDKGLLLRIERSKYVPASRFREMDLYELACNVTRPSYLSLWSGLYLYGYTAQVTRTAHVMVAISRPPLEIQGQRVQFVKTRHFFGYRSEGCYVIAEPEKLFLDCLLFPELAGGIGEIRDALGSAELNGARLIEYALRIGNRSLISRLGFLIEETGKDIDLSRLRNRISRSYVPLDQSVGGKGEKIKRWMLTVDRG
ncbi:MAG: hypothetical protein AB1665_03575 [Candidatus Thermoplasmatota archaeon]